jgi:signal peptide peptidase A. Serine peptidase. MEROPS family S49
VKEIKKLTENDKVKAVVFRINSPGGSANASDEILFELQQLRKKKPLIVSFGDYAASGGYYIAMGADKIYSEPNTLTGSIGVFGMIPNFKEIANKNRSKFTCRNNKCQFKHVFPNQRSYFWWNIDDDEKCGTDLQKIRLFRDTKPQKIFRTN